MYWYQTHESNIVSNIGHKALLDSSAADLLLFYVLCGQRILPWIIENLWKFRCLTDVAFTTVMVQNVNQADMH